LNSYSGKRLGQSSSNDHHGFSSLGVVLKSFPELLLRCKTKLQSRNHAPTLQMRKQRSSTKAHKSRLLVVLWDVRGKPMEKAGNLLIKESKSS
jgi:hypothetical protein